MSEVTKTFKYSQSSKYWTIMLLLAVIVITIGFAVYNHFLEKEIVNISQKIEKHTQTIDNLKWEKKVHVFSLIKTHKSILEEMDERSHITKYINHVMAMSQHYNFKARGFKIWGGTISSKVEFNDNDFGIAYKKAVRFISDYRKDETALMDLEFINGVSWTDNNIKFPVLFTLKK